MLPLCSWAGTWYLAILVIFSLLLASENWRAGFWISQQNNPPPPTPRPPALLYNIPVSFLGFSGVLFTVRILSLRPPPHPLAPPPFSVPWETCFHIDSLPAAFNWPIPCTLRRPHEPWRDLSQFFCSQVSTDCCLTVQEGPGYLRTVFTHSSCHAPNIQWAVSYPRGRPHVSLKKELVLFLLAFLPDFSWLLLCSQGTPHVLWRDLSWLSCHVLSCWQGSALHLVNTILVCRDFFFLHNILFGNVKYLRGCIW